MEGHSSYPVFLAAELEHDVDGFIGTHADRLAELSHAIWEHPELNFQEFFATQVITEYLERQGHKVIRNHCGLATSFVSEFVTNGYDPANHPTVAILCEYDALPELGHACGHNLISEAGLAAFLAVCDTLKKTHFQGKIVCMGTPAEEDGSGKIHLLRAGAFRNIDFAMMVHPAPYDILELAILGNVRLTVEFFGRAAHASCGPWEGVNALDAAVAAYNNISLLRQALKPGHQVHIIILNGGAKPNIIPDYTKSQYMIRAPTIRCMEELKVKLLACIDGAALATGCRVETSFGLTVEALMNNKTILGIYKHHGLSQGMVFPNVSPSYGSTDMGNVSTVVPSIHPAFGIGEMEMIHTSGFQKASGEPAVHKYAHRAAIVMAMTTLELIANPDLRVAAKEEFRVQRLTFVGNAEAGTTKDFMDSAL